MDTKFEPLSVAEDNNKSNRVAATAMNHCDSDLFSYKIYIDDRSNLGLEVMWHAGPKQQYSMWHQNPSQTVLIPNLDLDSLIQYLQEAKAFVSESNLARKLTGQK